MCLGIPARVVAFDADTDTARVDMVGVIGEIQLGLLDGPWKVGDYVLVHGGFALTRLSEAEAHETLELLTSSDWTDGDVGVQR